MLRARFCLSLTPFLVCVLFARSWMELSDASGGDIDEQSALVATATTSMVAAVDQQERPAVYPAGCSDATGPYRVLPAPPLPPSDLTSVHIYIKGSSRATHVDRSRWISRSWGREVFLPHTLTFVMDGSNATAEEDLREEVIKYQDDFNAKEAVTEEEYGRGQHTLTRGQGRSNRAARISVQSVSNTENFGDYHHQGGKRPGNRSEQKKAMEKTLQSAYAAQRLKLRWVLNQSMEESVNRGGNNNRKKRRHMGRRGSASWRCYLDDDLVVNMTNLVRDLRAKHLLCSPNCWISMSQRAAFWTIENIHSAVDVTVVGHEKEPPPRVASWIKSSRSSLSRNDKKKAAATPTPVRAVEDVSRTMAWPTGGWCMEAELIERLQRELLPMTDERLEWLGADDDDFSSSVMYRHFGILPLHSDRWMIEQRPWRAVPRWFRQDRREMYAVYHQVDFRRVPIVGARNQSVLPFLPPKQDDVKPNRLFCPRNDSVDVLRIRS